MIMLLIENIYIKKDRDIFGMTFKINTKKLAANILLTAFIGAGAIMPGFSQEPAATEDAVIPNVPHTGSTASPQKIDYINNLYLAYVRSDNELENTKSARGLDTLVDRLRTLTSVEPAGSKSSHSMPR